MGGGGNNTHFAEVPFPLRATVSPSENEEVGLDDWFSDFWIPRPDAWTARDLAILALQGLLVVVASSWPTLVPL